MTSPEIEFANLLCSRLCHDLLSPVGALNNGIELLADEDDPDMRSRIVELLAESAKVSAAKLKFFRLAFGAAGGFGDQVDTVEAKQAIEGLFGQNSRLQIGWMVSQATMDKAALKILLNLALIAGDALVRGGRLDIGAEENEIAVRAEGPRLVLDEELRTTLTTEVPLGELSARAVVAGMAAELARGRGATIQLSEPEPTVLVFGVSLPAA
ncbi:histidine phosphotransferase family protein [Sphingomonas sp. ID0503]|uniref:histidine phosphotransferase family protein n=1 Tax=Sphingomonas sp. ID0503 TaxID=3399691 RepID=UPI003AFB7BB8